MIKKLNGFIGLFLCITICYIGNTQICLAEPDWRFDVATFQDPGTLEDHFRQAQFDVLNWQGTNGHYIAMGTDTHRPELMAKGNEIAVYYNDINTGWTGRTGAQGADTIHQHILENFTYFGSPPTWMVLNEISAGQWPDNSTYRYYIHELVHTLASTYHYQVILCSPFPTPGQNSADWQAVTQDAYIAIEQYLSGEEILSNGTSVSWCQSQYQNSKTKYLNLGVAANRLFLIEHFGQTTTGTVYGRAGVSRYDWDTCIIVRSQAACNVGFDGYLTYAWGKNKMGVSDEELIHFEDVYRQQPLPSATSDYYIPAAVREWQRYDK